MPGLTPLTGESLASVVPEGMDDTASSGGSAASKREKRKEYGFGKRFAYQKLRGWHPILSAHNAEILFVVLATIMLAAGIPILIASLNITEYSVRYDDAGPMAGLTSAEREAALWAAPNGITYTIDVPVDKGMQPPIFVVFELGYYYQNYRRYVRSYDPNQMHDFNTSIPGVEACLPFLYEGADDDTTNPALPLDGAIVPCGQISHSLFNDTFGVALGDVSLPIDDSSIAWQADADELYGNITAVNFNVIPEYRGGAPLEQPLNQAQHWMVWQRPSGKVPTQKLYGRIDQAIPAGSTVKLTVNNRYNTYAFDGVKRVILSTNSWMGGRNTFLPILYLVLAGLGYALAMGFFAGYDLGWIWKRTPGVTDDFSWVRNVQTHGGTPLPSPGPSPGVVS